MAGYFTGTHWGATWGRREGTQDEKTVEARIRELRFMDPSDPDCATKVRDIEKRAQRLGVPVVWKSTPPPSGVIKCPVPGCGGIIEAKWGDFVPGPAHPECRPNKHRLDSLPDDILGELYEELRGKAEDAFDEWLADDSNNVLSPCRA